MWGDRDHALEPGLAEASIARCDAGEVFHFPDATHWLAREEPERVTALLLEFLRLSRRVARSGRGSRRATGRQHRPDQHTTSTRQSTTASRP